MMPGNSNVCAGGEWCAPAKQASVFGAVRHSALARALKGRLQEWQAAWSLSRYRRIASSRGLTCVQGPALRRSLQQRLAGRPALGWPKKLGDAHIFLAYSVTNWEAVLPRALAPFGRVTEFDWRGRGYDDRQLDWVERRDAMNKAMLAAFNHANRAQPVDAVIGYLSGYNTAPSVLSQMATQGAAVFNFCLDDKLFFPGKRLGGRYISCAALAPVVDLNLTNAPDSPVKYAVHGGLAMFFPEAAHPEVHKPVETPFEFDVSFVGARYGWRSQFVTALERQGIRVECFGRGWPKGPLSDSEMVRLYSRSRINLGFSGVGHSRRLMCLKGRDFEVPMSGGLYLTQNNPELALVFEVGKEIVTYESEKDCAETIRGLLANPARAAEIRRCAHIRCLRDHTYEARWKRVFILAGLLRETY
jgi:spore maturation protein CgeB